MSPGSRPSQLPPKPLHNTSPSRTRTTPKSDEHFSDLRHRLKRLRPPSLGATVSAAMQLGQLSEASLYAADLAAARRFYHEILGLEIVSTSAGTRDRLSLRCDGSARLRSDADAGARRRCPHPWRDRPRPRRLRGRGARSREAGANIWPNTGSRSKRKWPWPRGDRSLYFRDPAGNVIEFARPTMCRPAASK